MRTSITNTNCKNFVATPSMKTFATGKVLFGLFQISTATPPVLNFHLDLTLEAKESNFLRMHHHVSMLYSLGITMAAVENKHSLNESNHASIKDDNIRSSQN